MLNVWRWEIDPTFKKFWYRPVSVGPPRFGWMWRGRRLASFTILQGSGHWMLCVGPLMICSRLDR